MPSVACSISSCGPPPCTSTVLMPTWCRMATCSIKPRVDASSLNTAPPALITKILFLYMRMYGAALLSARTATDGSGRFIIILRILRNSRRFRSALRQHAVQNSHLHRQPIEGLALDHRARTVEDFVGHRDVAPHRQAMHQLCIRQGAFEPA